MGPWELPLQPSSPTPPSFPGLSFNNPPSSLSFLSPSPSWSLPVSPSLYFFHFSNLDHFPGCLLPSSPSTDGRPLPPPLSLRFLRFLLFPPYNVEQMSLFLRIFLVPPAALELRSLSSSPWACLDSFVSCPLARSHFRVLSSQCPQLHLHPSGSLAIFTPPPVPSPSEFRCLLQMMGLMGLTQAVSLAGAAVRYLNNPPPV